MSNPQILVADDSRTIRSHVGKILSEAGFEVILASDGCEAVEIARRESPDLVILDIQMPIMDGYQACEEILAMDDSLPIVFLTKNDAQHLKALGDDLGAYLQKPVSAEELLTTVRSLLTNKCTPEL
jgi:DNA-binding response OmpR family regulator